MPTYTVYEPPSRESRAVSNPERFEFVRDGFSVWAFVLPPVWMLLHRLWLVLVAYLAASAAIGIGMYLIQLPEPAPLIVGALVALLVALEAGTLRRWTLMRRGWIQAGFVVAGDAEDAERRFFAKWAVSAPTAVTLAPVTPLSQQKRPDDVIGLFPRPGAAR